jgi:hypothetical protein
MHLRGRVSYGSCSDTCHAVDASVTRSRGLSLFLYRAGWGKYVLERLWAKVSRAGKWLTEYSPKQESDFWKARSTGHQDRTPDLRIRTLATGHQKPTSRRWQASFVFWCKESTVSTPHHPVVNITYSGSFQSAPAGQRSAPVALWWKPRFVLTLRERGGFSGTSRGVNQSSTAPFILFVSSDLALETPFWT